MRTATIFALTLFAAACGSSSSGSPPGTSPTDEVVAQGTLMLSGVDTAVIGDQLEVGDVARLNGPGDAQTYFCVDTGSRLGGFDFAFDEGLGDLAIGDPLNTFVINAIDGLLGPGTTGVSMTVIVQGVSFDFTCAACGGITFDDSAQTIVFDDVVVDPAGGAETGSLTIRGGIAYGLPQ